VFYVDTQIFYTYLTWLFTFLFSLQIQKFTILLWYFTLMWVVKWLTNSVKQFFPLWNLKTNSVLYLLSVLQELWDGHGGTSLPSLMLLKQFHSQNISTLSPDQWFLHHLVCICFPLLPSSNQACHGRFHWMLFFPLVAYLERWP